MGKKEILKVVMTNFNYVFEVDGIKYDFNIEYSVETYGKSGEEKIFPKIKSIKICDSNLELKPLLDFNLIEEIKSIIFKALNNIN